LKCITSPYAKAIPGIITQPLKPQWDIPSPSFNYHIGCFIREIRKMSKKKVQRETPLDW